MRETKSRGLSSRGWVYGTPVFYKYGTVGMVVVEEDRVSVIAVEPETVGEFTNLKDESGKEIYEGDVAIVVIPEGLKFRGVVAYGDGCFCIGTDSFRLYNWPDYKIQVIGNIHENPEILEVL
jgi:uncharacterized phage protein (TIGR01671 family)